MKKQTVVFVFILLIFIIGLLVFQKNQAEPLQQHEAHLHQKKATNVGLKSFYTEATIGGIGDILIHDWVYEDAKTDGGYDFHSMFSPVRTLLQKPDFLIANQESIPGGTEIGITSYPSFNSPHEIIDALMDAGVDMVTTANNHTLDRGERAILSAIDYYEQKNLPYTGSFKSPEDKEEMRIINVSGIRIAVLAYATHFNGIRIPEGKDYLVSVLEPNQVLADIEKAKQQADVTLLALHWGDEYVRQPNATQKELAKQFIEAGADIILGHHPHVLQPMEWIEQSDGKRGLVIYSLGNFLSGQIWDYKDVGGMVEIKVRKEIENGETTTSIEHVELYPTFTASKNFRNYEIYPLDAASEKGLTTHSNEEIKEFFQTVK
ncbi:CapA family protein [Bacillus sp. FJAT-50079]|uniref:CapA family protein n=1 Tax=Bacillus sp. FJAT-50079 TaxID=2833577 RepID=UPI001BC9186C|nr:CapA family protein [Bacillus sp. FJAT-50079]MBS4207412.1 CapA family protein [Bacillus sp. FJAT-50079]